MSFDDVLLDGPADDAPAGGDGGSGEPPEGPRPPIRRVEPRGEVVRPGWEIPVIATVRYTDGRQTEVFAVATAWTRSAVEITWDAAGFGSSTDWVPTADVRPAPPRAR